MSSNISVLKLLRRSVAIYQQNVGLGNELVMVSEMNAGWYRYIMEWRYSI